MVLFGDGIALRRADARLKFISYYYAVKLHRYNFTLNYYGVKLHRCNFTLNYYAMKLHRYNFILNYYGVKLHRYIAPPKGIAPLRRLAGCLRQKVVPIRPMFVIIVYLCSIKSEKNMPVTEKIFRLTERYFFALISLSVSSAAISAERAEGAAERGKKLQVVSYEWVQTITAHCARSLYSDSTCNAVFVFLQ